MKFIIDNFSKMTGGHMPGVNKELHHRFIQGFVPHYFTLASEASDTSLYKKVNPPYPLVLSPGLSSVRQVGARTALSTTLGSSVVWASYASAFSPAVAGVTPTVNGTPAQSSSTSGATTQTTAVTVPSGTNQALVVLATSGTNIPQSATFGGVAMTAGTSGVTADNLAYRIFYLVNPTASTANVVVTWSTSTDFRSVMAVNLQGVHQTSPVRDSASASGTSTTAAVSLVVPTNGLAVGGVISNSATHSQAGGQTEQLNFLADSTLRNSVSTKASTTAQYPVLLLANEHNALGKVIYSTNLWEFFSDDSSETSLGIPTGTPTSNVGIDAVLFNGKILTSHPTNASLYYGAVSATPAWAASTGVSLTTGNIHRLKLFEDRCLVTDASSGAFTRSDAVRIVLPDFSIINGIELGDTFDIQDIGNYHDRYAILFTQKTTGPLLSKQTTVFLWNAVAGDSYDEKVTLKGLYKCSAEKDGITYAFTQVGTTVLCSAFDGASFREIGRLKNTVIGAGTGIPKSRVAVEGEFFVLLASSSGNTTNVSPLYWNPATGEAFYLVKATSSLPYLALLVAQDPASSSFAYARYLSFKNASDVGFLYTITLEDTTKADMGADYKGNFIPAPIVEGLHDEQQIGRVKINRIDIEYSVKPPSVNDIISFTLTTKDEHISETYDTHTATIKNTTANSTSAAVEDKRAIIDDIGKQATEFAINFSATVATTSWDLIIRRIVIDYTPIAHQS